MPDTTIKKVSSGASPKGEMGQVYLDGPKRAISAGCSSFSICSSGCELGFSPARRRGMLMLISRCFCPSRRLSAHGTIHACAAGANSKTHPCPLRASLPLNKARGRQDAPLHRC
jgi:hypothetical protein